ncbi:MAG: flagellar motor switch protein FliN [Phycisphaerales bacterium]|jgi:flagellar motor switch protein FliN/FliY|nr:flagellar motor switch protein FliN [Phycisphaerales bacterium]
MDEQDPQGAGEPTPETNPEAPDDAAADAADSGDAGASPEGAAPSAEDGNDELNASASAALAAAREAIAMAKSAGGAPPAPVDDMTDADDAEGGEFSSVPAYVPPVLAEDTGGAGGESIDLLSDVALDVMIELGRTRMLIEDVLRLGDGAVVELDKVAGDPVDIYVNERRVARGEVLVLNDNFCVRISEILDNSLEAAARSERSRAAG